MKYSARYSEEDLKVLLANTGKVRGGESRAVKKRVVDARYQAENHPMAVPKGNMLCAPSPKREFDSKWEETFCSELVLRKHAGLIRNYWYHPWTFRLPGGVKLEIDFLIEYPFGLERKLQVMEIKGWHKNIREAMAKLKIAAAIWPCFQWSIGRREKGGGWHEKDIE